MGDWWVFMGHHPSHLKELLTVSCHHQSVMGAPVQAAAWTPLDFHFLLRIIWHNYFILFIFFTVFFYTGRHRHVRLSHHTCWMWAEGRRRDGGIRGRNSGWNILLLLLNELQQSTPRCCTLSVQLQEALFHTAGEEGVGWCCLSIKRKKSPVWIQKISPEADDWGDLETHCSTATTQVWVWHMKNSVSHLSPDPSCES